MREHYVDKLPWTRFKRTFFKTWQQGEHVAILGPTGMGKSVLGTALIKGRARYRNANVLATATKPRDKTMQELGWPIIHDWPPDYGVNQVVLWPPYGDPHTAAERQASVFTPVLRSVFKEGDRTIYLDEALDFEERMKMGSLIDEYWRMGRSNNLTLVAGTQRPRHVSRSMFSEPSWLFSFRIQDMDDLRRVGEIGGDTHSLRRIIAALEPHDFLCLRRRTGEMVVSRVEVGKKVAKPEPSSNGTGRKKETTSLGPLGR